jgi:CHAD domain-containing protein
MGEESPAADTPMRSARQALLAQLDKAVRGLAHHGKRSDQTIHEIRKELKRARASLRLLRKCLGSEEYHRENALIRDAARPLTPVRDAKVLLDTMRSADPRKHSSNSGAFKRYLYSVLREQQRAAHRELRGAEIVRIAGALRAIRRRAASLPDERLELIDPFSSLKHAYRAGYRAFERVRKRRIDEHLHEWRKQTKYFANQLEILVPFHPERFAKSHKKAHRLADQLGDDHDLALLTEQIFRHAKDTNAASQDESVEELIGALARQRKTLQRKALRLGRKLYSSKPQHYRP